MRPDGAPGLLVVPPGFQPERSLGWQLVSWMETFLCHGPGDIQGDELAIDDELKAFEVMAYGLGSDGRRLVNRAVLSRLKGRSKSEIAGANVCGEFIGPVRFDHWAARGETSWWGYAYEKGEPVGRPVRSPFIRCLATEEEQSGNTYDNVAVMLEYAQLHWPEHFGSIDLGRTAQSSTRIFRADGGEIRPSTSASASKDGGKESFGVGDEVHLYNTRELRTMHNTVTRNLTKRPAAEPWFLETTTMFEQGEDSVAEKGYDYATSIASGKVQNRGLLYDHREGPEVKNWNNDKELEASIRVAAGAAKWMPAPRMVAEIRDPKTSRSEGERYFINRPSKAERMAIDAGRWKSQARPDRIIARGERIGAGFDGSISEDSTALVGCTEDGHSFLIAEWSKPHGEQAKGWRVPRRDVHEAVRMMFDTYDVGMLLCDPAKWWSEIDEWSDRYRTTDRDGKDVERVEVFDTNVLRRMARACDRYSTSLIEGTHTHDGNPTLTAHVLAMARKKVRVNDDDADGRTRFVFVKADTRKIDAGIADVLAVEAAATMPTAPAPLIPAWGGTAAAEAAKATDPSVFRPKQRLKV